MTDFSADKLRQECGSRVLHNKVHEEARKRDHNDATQSGYDHHVVRVAAEHGARLAILAMAEREKRMREALEPFALAALQWRADCSKGQPYVAPGSAWDAAAAAIGEEKAS